VRGKGTAGRTTGLILMILGASLLLWPAAQYVYAQYHQNRLMEEFAESSTPQPTMELPGESASDEGTVASDRDERPLAAQYRVEVETYDLENDGPFVIRIETLGIELPLVYGVEPEDLSVAPGFYPQGVGPGEKGNMAIAGHRTTYGAPFRHLNDLNDDDHIVVASSEAEYVYAVEEVFVVDRYAWEVIDPTPEPKLTLTTCHPVGSAEERLVVRAGYVERRSRSGGGEPGQ